MKRILREMKRILREMVRAVAMLPLWVKFFIGVAILLNFIAITQWERLPFKPSPVVNASKVTVSPQQSNQRFDFPDAPPADKTQSAAIEDLLGKRMARIVIDEPKVEPNGSLKGNGQTLYLYGIKQFDSKQVCTRASGVRWACGLHAYATLRNSLAKKTITCDPKRILPNGVSATCRTGATDIVLPLIHDGLAELDDNIKDTEMVNAQAFAKSQKLGIWDR